MTAYASKIAGWHRFGGEGNEDTAFADYGIAHDSEARLTVVEFRCLPARPVVARGRCGSGGATAAVKTTR